MIWCARCNRSELLAWLAGEPALREFESTGEPVGIGAKKGILTLGWSNRPDQSGILPVFVLVHSSDLRDFLAWSTTYLGGFKPFTSLVRVLDEENLILLASATPVPDLFKEAAWAGAIIGEALEAAGGRLKVDGLSVRACSSSYLFAFARSAALWQELSVASKTASCWERARQIARGELEKMPFSRGRESAARTLASSQWPLDARSGVEAALIKGAATDSLLEAAKSAIVDVMPGLARYLSQMEGPREERICAFEAARDMIAGSNIDNVRRAVFLAALLSIVGPGSMDYVELAMSEATRYPGMLIWYGVFAGLSSKSTLLSDFEGFGRRIVKELQYGAELGERPRCDIALAELEVLVGGGKIPRGWRVANPGNLTVEIQPTIYVTFPWPSQVVEASDVISRRPPERSPGNSAEQQLGLSYSSPPSGKEPTKKAKPGARRRKQQA